MVDLIADAAIQFWMTLCDMAPYLLFGFLMAGILSALISTSFVERHLGGSGFWPVVKASLFGIPLPLCSCSVIPVAASLRRHGSSEGATTAFLISTPQTGADSMMVTFSLLGPVFALFRPLAAFISGILGGTLVQQLALPKPQYSPDKLESSCTCGHSPKSKLAHVFHYGFVVLPQDIALSLLVGLLIAGTIAVLVPANFFADVLGNGLLAMGVMLLLGIPVYVCATASIPVAAAMILKGVTPGAALVFLMTGPATNAATITTLWRMFGHRTTVIYLAAVALTALGSGVLFDQIFSAYSLPTLAGASRMLPPLLKTISAGVLLIVLTVSFVTAKRKRH